MLSTARRLLKLIHPEGIPWPGTLFYNAISKSDVFQRHYDLVAKDIAGYCAEGKVLDVGTGPGWLLLKLHQRCPHLQLTGLDASPAMVAKARANMAAAGLAGDIEMEEGNVSHMPFADGSFDAVVSTGSIHHWKDPTAGLNDVYRVLKPGGHALIYDLVSDTPASILQELAQEFGRLRVLIFWLHGFEEPFHSTQEFESLPHPTLFKEGQVRFVGVLCCLTLKRGAHGEEKARP